MSEVTYDAGSARDCTRTRIESADVTTAEDASDAPVSGKKLVISDMYISTDTDMEIDILEEDNATPLCSLFVTANIPVPVVTRAKFKLDTADKKVQVQASAAGEVRVTTWWYSEA